MLSVDEINKLQAENEELRKADIIKNLFTVFTGAILGTIFGQVIVRTIYGIMDAILK